MATGTQNLSLLGKHFSDENAARELLEKMRWPNGVACPRCGGANSLVEYRCGCGICADAQWSRVGMPRRVFKALAELDALSLHWKQSDIETRIVEAK